MNLFLFCEYVDLVIRAIWHEATYPFQGYGDYLEISDGRATIDHDAPIEYWIPVEELDIGFAGIISRHAFP